MSPSPRASWSFTIINPNRTRVLGNEQRERMRGDVTEQFVDRLPSFLSSGLVTRCRSAFGGGAVMAAGGFLIRWVASRLCPASSTCRLYQDFEVPGTRLQNEFFIAAAERRSRAAVSPSCAFSFLSQRDFLSDSGSGKKRKKQTPLQEQKMIDKFRIHVRGGEGGAGCTSFRKSRQARHGSADGGNGGSGGDVILVSSAAVWDFSNLQHHLNGGRGGPGSSKKKVGSRGLDKIVQVPVGTVVHLVKGSIPSLDKHVPEETTWEEWKGGSSSQDNITAPFDTTPLSRADTSTGSDEDEQDKNLSFQKAVFMDDGESEIITPASARKTLGLFDEDSNATALDFELSGEDEDPNEDDERPMYVQSSVAEFVGVGQSLTLAYGGEGGKGNASMARGRGAEKTLPSLEHEQGKPGSEADLILELKTIADVGLVGAPNAGKSTLLGSLSRAKPVTGHYKFTTLRPNIGKLEFEDYFSFTVADIPGLIEGAHENRGLGHAFLRHIERTKVLAYVVDLSAGIGENPGPLPWDQIQELISELEQYLKGLSKRPSIVVANKIDEEGAPEVLEELKRRLPDMPIYPVCAVLEEGVDVLKEGLRNLVENTLLDAPKLSEIREL